MKQINILCLFKLLSFSCVFCCAFFLVHINQSIAAEGSIPTNSDNGAENPQVEREIQNPVKEETYKVPSVCNDSACYNRYYYQWPDNDELVFNASHLLRPTISYKVFCEIYKIHEDKIRCSKVDCMYVIPILDEGDQILDDDGSQIARNCRVIEMDPPKDSTRKLISAKYFTVDVDGYYYKEGEKKKADFLGDIGFCSTKRDRIKSELDLKAEAEARELKAEAEASAELEPEPEPCIVVEQVSEDEVASNIRRYNGLYPDPGE